ncbi:MAG: ATP-binding protein [Lachnospiraceae bacterium]|nr:ATP-binding protein [Lachnospiraceae bacterium]
MRKKAIAIGIEEYKRIIDKPYYYIDKTLLIKEILDKGGSVNLFTRPRRFGKTLALSMIKTFFEKDMDIYGNLTDNRHYFDGMKIIGAGENYTKHVGQYPVISLSLKSAKQPDFDMAYTMLVDQISSEFKRHRYILNTDVLLEDERKQYEEIMLRKAERAEYATALKFLSDCLKKYHERNVIILIDEYDVPLENSYFAGFYNEMITFIRSLFESALKTNDSLEFAVITGCLRISKESIFTGLNNLAINSILNIDYAEYFGFTQNEVEQMLGDYDLSRKVNEVKEWYDGYLFGKTEVYNPWSVINYVRTLISDPDAFPKPYWSNTSSNSIIRELIEEADSVVKQEIEDLLAGGTIDKPIHEDITYEDIHKTQDNLWNFLFFTGYLKKISERKEERNIYLEMALPNEEIGYVYENTILEWFDKRLRATDLNNLHKAILEGDCETFENEVSELLLETISFYDYAENYYHGFLCGLLKGCNHYTVISNRESGNGRPDILFKYLSVRGQAVIMELKVVKEFDRMEAGCDEALRQIEEQNYEAVLYKEGYRKIRKYGICFYRKECMVKEG